MGRHVRGFLSAVGMTCGVLLATTGLVQGGEVLYKCHYNGSEATYGAAEMTRMRALGAVCEPLSAAERVTCAMDGLKHDYSVADARRVLARYPDAVCETGSSLVVGRKVASSMSGASSSGGSSAEGSGDVTLAIINVNAPAFQLAGEEVVYFRLGSSRLSAEARRKLQAFARRHADSGHYFTITGHADASGSSGFNHTLSLKRAGKVRDVLRDMGIAEQRIVSVNALGEESLRMRTRNGVPFRYNRAVVVRAYR